MPLKFPAPTAVPASMLVVDSEATSVLRDHASLAPFGDVTFVADGPALVKHLESSPSSIVICAWTPALARWIEKAPHPPRVIHFGASAPEAMLEAIGHGLDIGHAESVERLLGLLMPARAKRGTTRKRPAALFVKAKGLARAHAVIDLSNDGLAFEVDAASESEPVLPGTTLPDVEITRRGRVVVTGAAAIVTHVSSPDPSEHGAYRVGCALVASSRAHVLASRVLIEDPVKAAGLLVRALKASALTVLDTSNHVLVPMSGGTLDSERGDISLPGAHSSLRPHDVVHGQFELGGSLHRFTSSVISDVPFRIRMPASLEETRRRDTARYRPREPMTVEMTSPLSDLPYRREVLDVSSAGVSFHVDAEHDVFPVGLRLPSVVLHVGGETFRARGVVRHVARRGSKRRCGVELEGLSDAERARLAERIVSVQFPGLEDGANASFEQLLGFFRAAGYLEAEREATLAPMMDDVKRTFDSLHGTPNHLLRALIYKDSGNVIGHISSVRAYRRTFMVQHLAAAAGRQTGHAGLHLSIGNAEYLMQIPDFDFLKIWFHAHNKFPARVFGGFARKVRDPEQCVLEAFVHTTLDTRAGGDVPSDIEAHEATDKDLARVERYFVRTRAPLLLRSDDLLRSTLTLGPLDADYRALGLERRRVVLMATRGELTLGCALVEVSSPGLNLFEALSRFSMHVFRAGHADATNVRRALLEAIRRVYRDAGRASASALIAKEEAAAFAELGLVIDADESMCLTTRRTQLRRFSEHMEKMVVSRTPKRATAPAPDGADEDVA